MPKKYDNQGRAGIRVTGSLGESVWFLGPEIDQLCAVAGKPQPSSRVLLLGGPRHGEVLSKEPFPGAPTIHFCRLCGEHDVYYRATGHPYDQMGFVVFEHDSLRDLNIARKAARLDAEIAATAQGAQTAKLAYEAARQHNCQVEKATEQAYKNMVSAKAQSALARDARTKLAYDHGV
jgi:hypothetical protein